MLRAYLAALHASGSAVAATGWQPHFLLLWRGDALIAACPMYLKTHSRGEYVFDHSWANAYAEHGLEYYPKLLCAVPFTPVQGSRLLAVDEAARGQLVQAMQSEAARLNASSVHVLFDTLTDHAATRDAQWATRQTVQFHWNNAGDVGFSDFESYLKTLAQDKAKKARAEMRKVREAGVIWRSVMAHEATTAERELMVRCYTQTYREHGNAPYLTSAFFASMFTDMAQHWLLCIASHPQFEGGDFACSLIALDPVAKVAYGRYWGALARVDSLHFDACYYQPLQWCIANSYQRFEGGAQGEHKMARGLLPVMTQSSHYIAHPQFASAILNFTQREQQGVQGYLSELTAHSPLRSAVPRHD
jgi:predicted N-acyltransferase